MTPRLLWFAPILLALAAPAMQASDFEEASGVIAVEASLFAPAAHGVRILAVRHAAGDIRADDVVTQIGGRSVSTLLDADAIARTTVAGSTLQLTVLRSAIRTAVAITAQMPASRRIRAPLTDEERPRLAILIQALNPDLRRCFQGGLSAWQSQEAGDAVESLLMSDGNFDLACKGLDLPNAETLIFGAGCAHDSRFCSALADLLIRSTSGTVRNNVGFALALLADPLTPVDALIALANDRSVARDGEARSKAPGIAAETLVRWNSKRPDIAKAYAARLVTGGFVEALMPLTKMTTRHLPDNAVICLEDLREFLPAEVDARSRSLP